MGLIADVFNKKWRRKKPLVLHVDDDSNILEMVKLVLRDLKIELIREQTAADGILKAVEKKPDLVLLDIMMPYVNGYEACREIKVKCPGTQILMITALGQMKNVEKALASGADDYITKPFTIDTLRVKVREMLNLPKPAPHS